MSWNTVEIEIMSAENHVLLWWLPSLTSRLDLHDWIYMYLGNKLLDGHVPDLFPWCGIHTRLGWYRVYTHHMHPKL